MNSVAEYFDEMSAIWDDAVLHNKTYIREVLKLLKIKEGDKIADVGCGTGVLIDYIREINRFGTITEIDISQKMLNMSRAKNYSDDNIRYLKLDINNSKLEGLFDVIILYDTLPYIANKLDVVTELYTTNLNIEGRLAIFHSRGEEQINLSLAHGDRRICDSYLPIFDNYLNELYNKGCKVIYSSNKSNDYTIILVKDI
ncbi:MAG: methyltransferase domain-containing protein [Bacteroidales bacterium]|nr:methyltransferase domain-containing protein [Bacteroidales bacterium]